MAFRALSTKQVGGWPWNGLFFVGQARMRFVDFGAVNLTMLGNPVAAVFQQSNVVLAINNARTLLATDSGVSFMRCVIFDPLTSL